jgi:hypothetical protein
MLWHGINGMVRDLPESMWMDESQDEDPIGAI